MKKKRIIIPVIIILAVVIAVFLILKLSPTANDYFSYYVLGKHEFNKVYIAKVESGDTYLVKPGGDIEDKSISWMSDRMNYINDEYLSESNVFYSIIPDKGYYLPAESGFRYLDLATLEKSIDEGVGSFAEYIDIKADLTLSDYYFTDSHWKQECITDVAGKLLLEMECEQQAADFSALGEQVFLEEYAGVYYDKVNLNLKKDTLKYLDGDYINGLKVTNYETGKPAEGVVYDFQVVPKENYYEFFLMGNKSLITIENPAEAGGKELIVFRDSFGSCIAPLLAKGYSRVTLVDIRYLSPTRLGDFIEFDGRDVLFLHSAAVINKSTGQIKK